MAAHHVPRFTPEQYLELERAAEYKSEYYNGEIFAMAGGTYAHFRIISNLNTGMALALRGGPCFSGTTELKVRTSPGGLHTYPDIVAICGEPRFADDRADVLLNPILIAEVLSKSTESNDRGLKFEEYRQIESLREYVLVSQTKPMIEVFSRDGRGLWVLREFKGLDSVCEFPSLGCSVKLSDVYAGVR